MNERLLTILLVEDNPADLELTLRALRKHKVSNPIAVARDGEEAIEVLREIKAHPVYRTVPVVMLTTSQQETDIRTSYELGANSYIAKPVDFDKFLEVVGRIDLYWLLTNIAPPAAQVSPKDSMPSGGGDG